MVYFSTKLVPTGDHWKSAHKHTHSHRETEKHNTQTHTHVSFYYLKFVSSNVHESQKYIFSIIMKFSIMKVVSVTATYHNFNSLCLEIHLIWK